MSDIQELEQTVAEMAREEQMLANLRRELEGRLARLSTTNQAARRLTKPRRKT